ncbi:Fur family transcriptional regulator [Sciscionella sediminilitoris]|uniref:Fur family transcriptional regulator n=1 Tax=Sciscionella sediminilitoris TaxID=1445613 RepID=UPI0009EB5861|nr:transcriptional repressor [Sciscionella sp. SE31]
MEAEQAGLRNTLHRNGLRMTPQRQLVLDAIAELEHSTPEQICAQVRRRASGVNITTVYRNLELLENLGLVTRTHLGPGAPIYAVPEHRHVHLVCQRCGATEEVGTSVLEPLAGTLRERAGFVLDTNHVALTGRCAGCVRKNCV